MSTNDKGDNEMFLGAVHRSPGICLTAEETPRKPQLGDRPEGRKEMKGRGSLCYLPLKLRVSENKCSNVALNVCVVKTP